MKDYLVGPFESIFQKQELNTLTSLISVHSNKRYTNQNFGTPVTLIRDSLNKNLKSVSNKSVTANIIQRNK